MSTHPMLRLVVLGAVLLAAACTRPSPSAFLGGADRPGTSEPAGPDAKGEACFTQNGSALPSELPVVRGREVFCGGWTQPVARVVHLRGGTDDADLDALASGGVWRTWLEQRVACGAPQATTLAGGVPARLLACTRRVGGWPHVALVAAGPAGPVVADGVAAAIPVKERLATGQPAGGVAGQARSAGLEIAARRMAAESFGTNDVGQYDRLMAVGRDLNQVENFAAAEDAYRAALALQERILERGRDNPNTVAALMHLALNVSNQGRHREAEALFARAAALTPAALDPVATPRLDHYRGLQALNAGKLAEAVTLLRRAEAGYGALVPDNLARGSGDFAVLADPTIQSALLGLAESRRNLAVALARSGTVEEASAKVMEARTLLDRSGLATGVLEARALRTEAIAAASLGKEETAARQLEAAARRFAVAAPGERPEALTLFLAGARRAAAGQTTEALFAFRAGADIVRARQIALPVNLVMAYLDALDAAAKSRPADAAALRREMFAAAQLAQRSSTVRFVQQASARIASAGGNAGAAAAVRRMQDADARLRGLFAERDAGHSAALDQRIAAAQQARAEAESEVAAAAPGYRQLLLSATTADAVAQVLGSREALATMLLGSSHGYVMVVRGGRVETARVPLREAEVEALVKQVRAGIVERGGRPGRFDPAPAQALHAALFGSLAGALEGAETLIVAPDGPLLAIPFGSLLTGPADPDALGAAPWLIRRHAIVHVPSPQTFVTLRGTGRTSAAPRPYAGFGDFVPPSQAQLLRSFPVDRCAEDARLAAGLVRLPGTRIEVLEASRLTGAGRGDVRLGPDFTAAALTGGDIGQHRVIHLATHALLPGELSCLPEPAIVVSPKPGAANADSAFVKASDLLDLKLDADLIIVSACNTGGPGGAQGGEALSGLARSFFYAGARGLMVTHWEVDDAAAALTIADALRRQEAGVSSGKALRGAQLLILDEAGRRLPESFAHPFYWAPFALIGDGRREATVSAAAGTGPVLR